MESSNVPFNHTLMADGINKQIDEIMLKFFGSQSEFLKYGHLYVIEAEPVKMEMMSHADFVGNTFLCQAITKLRIRFKTPEELEAEKHD